jgi:predicted RNase H-like nuclease (RuvC/YqgF family)
LHIYNTPFIKQTNNDIHKKKTEKKNIEREFKDTSKKVTVLTTSLDNATKQGVDLSNQVMELKKIKANLEDTNKFLVRKGLELAGTGKGGTAFDFGVTSSGGGKTKVEANMLEE